MTPERIRVHRRPLLRRPWALCALLLASPAIGHAQAIRSDLYVANGDVNTVVLADDKLYIGGLFSHVGPATGSAVPIDAATGLTQGMPRVNGVVNAVVPDGAGGWYVGGNFTQVGDVLRSNIAQIQSDHTVSSWNPGANGDVTALAVSGGLVYAGGNFTTIGGQPRNRIAAVDAGTGSAVPWNPDANGFVLALVVNGGTVYAAGWFGSIGGQTRNRIAALDAATGLATSWNPNATGFSVDALFLSAGKVYAGGSFSAIGGQPRSGIAALDAATGTATSWDPGEGGIVFALVESGGTLYVGGGFASIGGQSRNYIAALDTATGLAKPWNPNASLSSTVRALAVSGSTVYAGGSFTTIGGQSRSYIAALDAVSGLATAWNPRANRIVNALAVSGDTVYAGGAFTSVGGVARSNIAQLDAKTGVVTAWNPGANLQVWTLAVRGNRVYAGGEFTFIGGNERDHIAALDSAGVATPWNPEANDLVYALALGEGIVYAGGAFSFVGGSTRNRVAALNDVTGTATAWNPNADGNVYALAVDDGTVYAGGDFVAIGGQSRNRIAALSATTGSATAWNPTLTGFTVNALAVRDGKVYAGGDFTAMGGQPRNHAAAVSVATGLATAWNPDADAAVWALALAGGTVYLGGDFTSVGITIGGEARNRIAAVDTAAGLATLWNPDASSAGYALAASESFVYAGGAFTSIGGTPQSNLAGIALAPEIHDVSPDRGGNDGSVTTLLSGLGFQSGSSAKLSRSGEPSITGSPLVVAEDGRSISATFDLTGAAIGTWDVLVTTPDLQEALLADAFTIEPPAPHEVRVNVLGPTQVRPQRRRAYDVVLENLGNRDVLGVPLWISGIPPAATVELDFPLTPPPQAGGEPNWSTVPLTLDGPGGRYTALVIPRLPPGTTVRRVYLTVPNPVASFTLGAALTPPWADGEVFRGCLSDGGVISAPACVGAQLTAIDAYLAATPGVQALSGIGLWAKIAWQCEGATTLPAALVEAEQVLDFMLQPVEGATVPAGCEVALVPRWRDTRLVTIVMSVDPNDKLGAGGVGAGRRIGSEQLLPYSIRFENLETATAPAQEVVVLDPLDLAALDVSTVSLGPITFGDRVVFPPPGLPSYTTDVDLRPAQDLIVRVGIHLDQATGILAWSFTSLHPTGRPLEDDEGFLPPNVTPPEGEGSVLFTVMPKPGLGDGAAISNQATLVFDGSPLLTPEWSNLLDALAPASEMLPLPATTDSASFTVRWSSTGSPPDLHDYSVYVSENGSPYRPWRVHTTATADTITAPGGRTYAFYSLARDASGNLEPEPGVPDVQTFSRVAVDERPPLRLALEGAAPNPTMGVARVWFALPSDEGATLEVVDVAGRRVFKRDVGSLGPGRHVVDVAAAARRPGLYFLRLAQGGRTLRARMVVVR